MRENKKYYKKVKILRLDWMLITNIHYCLGVDEWKKFEVQPNQSNKKFICLKIKDYKTYKLIKVLKIKNYNDSE